MIRQTTCVWLQLPNRRWYPMSAGITQLREKATAVLLETPLIDSPLRGREILSHTAELVFEGQRDRNDPVCEFLAEKYLQRGEDARVFLVIYDEADQLSGGAYLARRHMGYVCIEDPGSGDGVLGGGFRGKIVYATPPEKGAFDEKNNRFIPY